MKKQNVIVLHECKYKSDGLINKLKKTDSINLFSEYS